MVKTIFTTNIINRKFGKIYQYANQVNSYYFALEFEPNQKQQLCSMNPIND